MLRAIGALFTGRWDFFAGLLWEHLLISLIAILIAVVIGGLAGILISEFQKAAKPTLGVINFLYTIPSISMLGFLIPFSGVGNATAVIEMCIRDRFLYSAGEGLLPAAHGKRKCSGHGNEP